MVVENCWNAVELCDNSKNTHKHKVKLRQSKTLVKVKMSLHMPWKYIGCIGGIAPVILNIAH